MFMLLLVSTVRPVNAFRFREEYIRDDLRGKTENQREVGGWREDMIGAIMDKVIVSGRREKVENNILITMMHRRVTISSRGDYCIEG